MKDLLLVFWSPVMKSLRASNDPIEEPSSRTDLGFPVANSSQEISNCLELDGRCARPPRL